MQLFWTIVGANIASKLIMGTAAFVVALIAVAINELKS